MIFGTLQFVEVDGHVSSPFGASSGVVQGSNLGPLLFIIFFHDVVDYIVCGKFIFAGDLKLVNVISSVTDCFDLQSNLDNLTN